MILNSLENIRLSEQKFTGRNGLVEHSGLKLLMHPKFQDTYFCFFREPEPHFVQNGGQ